MPSAHILLRMHNDTKHFHTHLHLSESPHHENVIVLPPDNYRLHFVDFWYYCHFQPCLIPRVKWHVYYKTNMFSVQLQICIYISFTPTAPPPSSAIQPYSHRSAPQSDYDVLTPMQQIWSSARFQDFPSETISYDSSRFAGFCIRIISPGNHPTTACHTLYSQAVP